MREKGWEMWMELGFKGDVNFARLLGKCGGPSPGRAVPVHYH